MGGSCIQTVFSVSSWLHFLDRQGFKSQLERVHVGHAVLRQWSADVFIQHGVVRSSKLPGHNG